MTRGHWIGVALAMGLLGCGGGESAAPAPGPAPAGGATGAAKPGIGGVAPAGSVDDATIAKTRAAVERGQAWLRKSQMPDGSWGMQGHGDPGLTAMAAAALLATSPGATRASHPAIWKGLDQLAGLQQPDGSVNARENLNYCTSVAVMAWLSSGDPTFREAAANGARYVAGGILDTGAAQPRTPSDPMYGGAGYGHRKEGEPPYADLSNTSYALEALMRARDAGLSFDQEAFKAATKFLERSQHRTESNDQPWASDLPRLAGGFIYHPTESKADMVEIDGKKHFMPYGTMTYAGIKSFIYARVDGDDPRVKAATSWIRQFYSLEQNPGFDVTRDVKLGAQGLYYYFDTFAKAHHALGQETFADADGTTHRWRQELAEAVVARQQADGSWVNTEHDRWWEAVPTLVTAYALTALAYCLPTPR